MLNLLAHEEDPQDPTGGPDSDASAEELYAEGSAGYWVKPYPGFAPGEG